MVTKILKKFFVCLILPLVFLFNACGPNLKNYYDDINNLSFEKDYEAIDKKIEANKDKFYGSKSPLLYYLDRGYFLHLAGDYENSNECFTQAKKLYDDYYTKSISNTAASLAVNDKIKPYYGDDFEISMLLVFKALNYLMLDQKDEATVEARIAIQYLKTLKNNNYSKKVYKDDAFLRYMTGIVFEIVGEYNDAYISDNQALNLYNTKYFNFSPPQELFNSTIAMAKKIGLYDEVDNLNKKFPAMSKNYVSADKTKGELIVLHYDGLVPHRISTSIQVAFGKAWANVNVNQADSEDAEDVEKATKVVNSILADDQITVALPKYVPTPYSISLSEIAINNEIYMTSDVTSLGDITIQNFDDRKDGIYAKCLARAAVKFTLVRTANKKIEDGMGDTGLSFLLKKSLSVTASLMEDADKRSWRVLPDKVKMARISLEQGTYSFDVTYKTNAGFSKTETVSDIEIKPNTKKFVILRTIE